MRPATGSDGSAPRRSGPAPGGGAPAITLPKGGGAIRGIGEKFGVNAVTGTSSITVPIATSPGRSGFGPQLELSYDSGNGNGPFGFGWTLSLPSVSRKTDKGVPLYQDATESDVFILSGAEDLVPVLAADGTPWEKDDVDPAYVVHRYRPRVESLFARIERWTRKADGDVHWRSISADNVLSLYGVDAGSRIVDADDPARISSWLISETRDDKGNAVLYEYKPEDGAGVDLTRAHERNRGDRDDPRRATNRYLKRIRYGNRAPLLDADGRRPRVLSDVQTASADWVFEVVFDYGEHDAQAPTPREAGEWAYRMDPFSSYRSGFEVRTARLCQRVLVFHHFAQDPEVGQDCLVRSTDFTYSPEQRPDDARNPVHAFLLEVSQIGYRRQDGGYLSRGMPPLVLAYSEPVVQDAVRDVDESSLENLPIGVDGALHTWVDLHGEGIPGVLTEQGGAWWYKRNVSPISSQPVEFAAAARVSEMPNAAVSGGEWRFMDLAGDGQPDLVVLGGPMPGVYEHHERDESWAPFRPFTRQLNADFTDPNLRLVDMDGDGRSDVLISEDDTFVRHASLGEEGFGPAQSFPQPIDEERGPRVVFSDGTQSVYLADFTGDGLTDLVRIRNGECCYWPNLGRRFGVKVTMDQAPLFDNPDEFDQDRIRLADIDGSGTTDLIYLHRDGPRLYFNQNGNSWSVARELDVPSAAADVVDVAVTDLLGNGTACLVWSSPLPGDRGRTMRYVDLMGGHKPHLLVQMANSMGAESRIAYAPSTRFFLQDKRAGRPWVTPMPFPVHVVERVESFDHISRNRFVTRYAYHHGHFDGEEREFRGFGMVEQWDAEQTGALTSSGSFPQGDNVAEASHVPPVHTRTWFHTGVHVGRDHVSDHFAGLLGPRDRGEYFREPGLADDEARELLLPDTTIPAGLTLGEEREACRALKGTLLRQELFADDAGPGATAEEIERARTPYLVTEQSFSVRVLQSRGPNRHAVFSTQPRESISFHYERDPADPRIQHALTLEVDSYGNVLKEAAVAYGRRTTVLATDAQGQRQELPNPGLAGLAAADRATQVTTLLSYTESGFTNSVEAADSHRIPLPCEALTFELTGYAPTGSAGRFQAADLVERDIAGRMRHIFVEEVAYEAAPTAGPCRRPIEWLRTLYRRDDLTGLLPLGRLDPLGLPGETYLLAFTPGLLAESFRRPRPGQPLEALLPEPVAVLGGQAADQGGYLQSQALKADGRFPPGDPDDHWWVPSGRSFYSADPAADTAAELAHARRHFFVARRFRDPFGHDAFVDFDADDLLMVETRDALGNRVTVNVNDYRVLQPRLVSDPNRNQTEVAFDALSMVVGIAVMGKPSPAPAEGDSLTAFAADLTEADLVAFFDSPDPRATAPALLQGATTRIVHDLDRFRRTRQAHPAEPSRWQPPCAATLARETHVRAALPPHGPKFRLELSYSDGFGRRVQRKVQAEPGPVTEGGPAVDPRWVGSEWTVYNNKGKAVRQFEPFFSADHQFQFDARVGVSPVLFYDPADRIVAALHPNGTFEKAVSGAWRQTSYDVNDTCAPRNGQTGDPRTDPDIRGYVAGYFRSLPADSWRSWHGQRIDGALGQHEQAAAARAGAHADTPTTVYLDARGRAFLTEARNRVSCAGHDLDSTEETIRTRVELDAEGNQRAVRDAIQQAGDPLGRIVVRSAYDMLGNRINQVSMDAGARWILNDVTGRPIRAWDARGHDAITAYDELRRPLEQRVRGTTTDSDPRTLGRELLVDRIEYGERPANAERCNLRTRVFRHFDSAGIATNARVDALGDPLEAYDFKGNLLRSTRRLVSDYTAMPDWRLDPALDEESFETATRYDALNRAVQTIAPGSSAAGAGRNVVQPVFNEANLLERVDVWFQRAAEPGALLDPAIEVPSPVGVAAIDYGAKGERRRIDYKNGTSTFSEHDPLTFRLTRLYTRRGAAFTDDCENPQPPPTAIAAPDAAPQGRACGLQNLRYTYDPAGNITHIQDDAQQPVFFRNRRVAPDNDYVYDALYRVIQAGGREHLGQAGAPAAPDGADALHAPLDHPGDGNALATYVERYVYDAVGSLLQMQHRSSDPAHAGWTRAYDHLEPSLTEEGPPLKWGNRLTRTTRNPNGAHPPSVGEYGHDPHGNVVRMPHLGGGLSGPNMEWDHRDQLRRTDLGGGGEAHYVYDASGRRVRKVWEKAPGLTEERIFLGDYEIFRRHGGQIGAHTATLERETLHVMDDRQRIALVEVRTVDTAGNDPAPARLIRYQLGNHLGSSALELDEQSQILSYEEYAPYGSSTYQAVRSHVDTPKRYGFTGKERDEESGLAYYGARYYAAWLGRWVSPDPFGEKGDLNFYAYCAGNPVNRIDADGADWEWCNPFSDSECGVVSTLEVAAGGAKEAAVYTGKIGVGVGKGAWGMAKGLYTMVRHPVKTGEGIYQAVRHPVRTAKAIGRGISKTASAVASGDPEAIGEAIFEVGSLLVPATKLSKTSKAADLAADVTRTVDKVTDIERAAAKLDHAGTAAHGLDDASKVGGALDDVAATADKLEHAGGVSNAFSVAARLSRTALKSRADELAAALSKQGLKRGFGTVGVLQGRVGGKIVTLVTGTNERFVKALKPLLREGESLVDPVFVNGISDFSGKVLKSESKGIWVHAEQVLGNESRARGLTEAMVATSNHACGLLCRLSFGNKGDLFPDIDHVNPGGHRQK